MKRFVGVLLAGLLLALSLSVVAESSGAVGGGFAYDGACPHELCSFGQTLPGADDAWGSLSGDGEYTSAMCSYCDRVYHVLLSGEPAHAAPRAPEICEHQFRREDGILMEGWYPLFNALAYDEDGDCEYTSIRHEYRIYYLCRCISCDTTVRMYEGAAAIGSRGEQHEFPSIEECGLHTHLFGKNQHLYLLTCTQCGRSEAVIVGCVMFDNGLCAVMLKEKLEDQGCSGETHDARTCPRCR